MDAILAPERDMKVEFGGGGAEGGVCVCVCVRGGSGGGVDCGFQGQRLRSAKHHFLKVEPGGGVLYMHAYGCSSRVFVCGGFMCGCVGQEVVIYHFVSRFCAQILTVCRAGAHPQLKLGIRARIKVYLQPPVTRDNGVQWEEGEMNEKRREKTGNS